MLQDVHVYRPVHIMLQDVYTIQTSSPNLQDVYRSVHIMLQGVYST